ncbi:LTA synthase family protein [Lujinxingia sediminis]|uniref:LTA synthase family protein n=1 Tax=Lujinxingia sediminis TaxID=2480984 RepID=A0ABY0CNR0_9DELT|nr:LTA synthase family protein [Lujinxingia sediminis]RVU41466.1 LTA synthase family protein [Lujinxingia sediminis]
MLDLLRHRSLAAQRRFLILHALPLMLLLLGLKSARVLKRAHIEGVLGALDLFKSELLFGLGFALAGVSLLGFLRSSRARTITHVALGGVAALVAGVEIVAHHFYISTGSTLDASLLMFSLKNFEETWNVISSEVPWWTLGALIVAVVFFLTGPLLLQRRDSPDPLADTRPWSGAMLAGSVCMLALACTPPLAEPYAPFARASVVNLGMSALDRGGDQDVTIVARPDLSKASLVASTETHGARPKHVALIVLESTRARSLSVYNPELDTTPFLAALAEKSLVAERAHAVVPHTSKALVATLCGIEPRLNMPITESYPGALPARCLADLLRQRGFATAFFQSATEHFEGRRQLIDNMGYEHFLPVDEMRTRGFEKANYFGYEDDIMLEPGRTWLSEQKKRPTFLTYLTLTPHHDYLAPERYGHHDFDPDEELNDYHNTIRYVDHFVANVMAQYKELGFYEDTLFVIVGDHGEGFGEHGRRQHDNVIYQEGLHIPMMLYSPALPDLAGRVEPPVSQIDLLPTIASLLGYALDTDYPGVDLREAPEERSIFSHCWYERRCMASIRGDDKYIHHFDTQPDERFDLGADPLETSSALARHDDNAARERELHTWRASVNAWHAQHSLQLLDGKILDAMPPVEHEVNVTLGDFARIRGYSLSTDALRPGSKATITYVFEALKPIPEGWLLFVHGNGPHKTKNLDHVPVNGLHPLHRWKPGEFIVDEQTFHVPRDWRPGEFKLRIGIYHKEKGRVEVSGDVPITDDHRATLFTMPVER